MPGPFDQTNPRRTPFVVGAVRGRVTRLGDLGSCYVKVPRLHGFDVELGPCETPRGVTVEVGDRVLLAAIEGRPGDYVVIAHLRPDSG